MKSARWSSLAPVWSRSSVPAKSRLAELPPDHPEMSIHFSPQQVNQRSCRLRNRRWMQREVDNLLREEGWEIPEG